MRCVFSSNPRSDEEPLSGDELTHVPAVPIDDADMPDTAAHSTATPRREDSRETTEKRKKVVSAPCPPLIL